MTDVVEGTESETQDVETEIVETQEVEETQTPKMYDESTVKKLNAEAKSHRLRAEKLTKELDEEKSKNKIFQSKFTDYSFSDAFNDVVDEFKPIYRDVVALKIDKSKLDLTELGEIKDKNQIHEQLTSIVENYPNLFGEIKTTKTNIDATTKGKTTKEVDLNGAMRSMFKNLGN